MILGGLPLITGRSLLMSTKLPLKSNENNVSIPMIANRAHLFCGVEIMWRNDRLIDVASAAAVAGTLILSMSSAMADQATYLSNNASYCEIFQAINPDIPEDCQTELGVEPLGLGAARSIKMHGAQQAAEGVAKAETGPHAFAMAIQFEFDSSQLSPEALVTLDRVADVLKSDLMEEKSIVIEGHTDAIGSDDYNMTLSTQRALSVQFYLAREHLIDIDRLEIIGKGEVELYDPVNPKAGINRRVEFTNLDS